MTYKPKMTHEERRARRAEIAKAVADGEPIVSVVRKFDVSHATVYLAAKEFDVPVRVSRPRSRNTVMQAVAMALQGRSSVNIARDLEVSRQRISDILLRAADAGVPIPKGVLRGRRAKLVEAS